jgi:replicative DNA helicase
MCLESVSFMLLCKRYVKTEYFSSDRLIYFSSKIYHYYDKYQTPPDKTFLKSILRDAKDKVIFKKIFLKRKIKEAYIRDGLKEFVKRSLFVTYYAQSGDLYNKGQLEQSYNTMMEGLNSINKISFNEDEYDFLINQYEKRILDREMGLNNQKTFKIKTGIPELDYHLKGGLAGGEVGMFIGDAKAGKSFGLIHIGNQNVKRFNAVLHIQLEGKKQQALDRYDACYNGDLYDLVKNNKIPNESIQKMKRIAAKRKFKDLIVRAYEDWDACDILDIERDYIELQSRGYDIKLVIIDYMDLMKSRKTFMGESAERHRQQSIIRDIKVFAMKHNVNVWTATQASRVKELEDPNFVLTSKNLSEDYGKVRVVDALVSINKTAEEADNNVARIFLDVARDNPAKKLIRVRQNLDISRFYVKTIKLAVKEDGEENVSDSKVQSEYKKPNNSFRKSS